MIQIYNSLTRRKQPLTPRVAGRLGLYVCGMTVYDYCHLGHARVMVVFDTVVRYLRASGLDVTYVRNITDIDDKIIRRAADNGEPVAALTARFIDAMHEDERLLAVLPPDIEPRATGHIGAIVDMITTLIAKGYAYQGDNGDVYYAVHRFADYGALSGESLEELRAGARIEPDEAKRDPLDFVLWKAAKPGEPRWDSPWGPGRPGWHIECSAMSTRCLGNTFDIHAGGMDLKFPHHENEIAQSEAATGEPFACLWMHNGYVQVDKEKMSKSLGNFFTIREILDTDTNRRRMGEVIRFMILASHYRSPLNYSDETLANARAGLTRLYLALDKAGAGTDSDDSPVDSQWLIRFRAAMDDDFNTAEAIAVLFDIARELNRALDAGDRDRQQRRAAELRYGAGVLGLVSLAPDEFLGRQGASLADTELAERRQAPSASAESDIDRLVTDRSEARRQRDWARADRIRARLTELGVIVEDKPDGRSVWRRQ